jgi:hypothetical protein
VPQIFFSSCRGDIFCVRSFNASTYGAEEFEDVAQHTRFSWSNFLLQQIRGALQLLCAGDSRN